MGAATRCSASRALGISSLDEFGLVERAGALLSRKPMMAGGQRDFGEWQALSQRASEVLELTPSPGTLAWVLDAFARGGLQPEQRGRLPFPRLFRKRIANSVVALSALSDDELCIAWSALERLQLLDKHTSLQFYRAAMQRRSPGKSGEGEGPRRCSGFSLRNWIRVAVALRGFQQHHPLRMDFVQAAALRLLVERNDDLGARGMQLEALVAVSAMTPFSSRQVHRATSIVHRILPKLLPVELAKLPMLCGRAGLADEALFEAVSHQLGTALAVLEANDLLACWRGLLRWRVGPPGMRSCAAVLICEQLFPKLVSKLPPRALVRLLRSFGRLDGARLREAVAVDSVVIEEAFAGALMLILDALQSSVIRSLHPIDVVRGSYALGRISRSWVWLENTDTSERGTLQRGLAHEALSASAVHMTEAAKNYLQVCASSSVNECKYMPGDLALLALALASLAQRFPQLDFTHVGVATCKQLLKSVPEHTEDTLNADTTTVSIEADTHVDADCESSVDEDSADLDGSIATAVLSSCAMLLMHGCEPSRVGHTCSVGSLEIEAVRCLDAWLPAARISAMPDRAAILKALSAVTTLGTRMIQDTSKVSDFATSIDILLPKLLESAVGSSPGSHDVENDNNIAFLEAWHLDECLLAIAVCECIGERARVHVQPWILPAIEHEICHRRSTLSERSMRFWFQKLCEPVLLERCGAVPLAGVCAELLRLEDHGDSMMEPAVVGMLRDIALKVGVSKEYQAVGSDH
eukprot:TRINITY_DN20194_c0_g2_i3.p1 TRINITY_DN20194_c0_g2~~TRINITY_DN20194_c0_g2_i3.p1  ORF type:complete len:797 (-),score=60.63 TRINITY_DN20194_c0_g2_i3:66-2324(-)